jgi:hypothetical protein
MIKDFNVQPNDPRTQFGADGSKPLATKFMEYIALLVETREPIAISFKGSGIRVAKQLNGMIRMAVTGGDAPLFAFRYILTPSIQKDAKSGGTYAIFSVKYAGDGWKNSFVTDPELYRNAAETYESIKEAVITIEDTHDADEPLSGGTTPF